ncbi:MAG: pentapeptide repeat-containing protein [Nitrospira sp.]|nr:pentapeptide repeat-containing protein [Nitrospira sp.]
MPPSAWFVSLLCVVIWIVGSGMSWGVCRVEEGTDPRVMVRELKGTCGDEDRRALAVSADDVLTTLQQGRGVVLKGVTLAGDLPLDRLRLQPFDPGLVRHAAIAERIEAERVSAVHVIDGPFILEDVEVQGILATNLIEPGYVVVRGPVSLRGSTIRQSMDFSRMVFLDRADFSGMHIGHEGFFIRAMFARDADFTGTSFGTHSRFHQARFLGKAAFTGARFHGLAEFLEVSFREDAEFARARFLQGTGFSGSRFHKTLDLSGARFEREVYFRFTEYQGDADFHRALFRNTADFTEARFRGAVDFREAVFEYPHLVSGVDLPDDVREGGTNVRDRDFLLLFFVLALLGLVLLAVWKKKAR